MDSGIRRLHAAIRRFPALRRTERDHGGCPLPRSASVTNAEHRAESTKILGEYALRSLSELEKMPVSTLERVYPDRHAWLSDVLIWYRTRQNGGEAMPSRPIDELRRPCTVRVRAAKFLVESTQTDG